nr:toll/interleukin-1 receptor domain-containing protein [uncultured Prevotella sp.]
MALKISGLKGKDSSISLKKEEKRWTELIDAVMDGKVIPVIGADFLIDNDEDNDANTGNLHQQIIDILASTYNVKNNPKSFSQVVYDKDFLYETDNEKDIVYMLINNILDQAIEEKLLSPNKLMMRLLRLRKFPFVITTSFTPIVEMAMRESWPDKKVRVLQFCNDPEFNRTIGKGDIESELDISQPTVYYMFGKYCDDKRYVVTDMDMMEFCKKWIAGGSNVPRVLTEVIKKRYLLILGNNYSDWLFRFIWYSMRSTTETMRSSMMVHYDMEPTLCSFLNRLQTFIEKDPEYVVSEIERRVNERIELQKDRNTEQHFETDVFLSYSWRDKEIVEKIHRALSTKGIRVWYDDNDIPGGADWKNTFLKGIRNTRLFIPVLSKNIEKEYMEPHEYREEWALAASLANKMGERAFIWPIAEKGFDFYNEDNRLPKEFVLKNASWYTIADEFEAFAEEVKLKVDEIKQKEEELRNG